MVKHSQPLTFDKRVLLLGGHSVPVDELEELVDVLVKHTAYTHHLCEEQNGANGGECEGVGMGVERLRGGRRVGGERVH